MFLNSRPTLTTTSYDLNLNNDKMFNIYNNNNNEQESHLFTIQEERRENTKVSLLLEQQ